MQAKSFVHRLINDDFVKASFFSALSSIIKVLTTLVIGKVVAILSGAEGFALFGQLLNFVLIITIITGGCITQGITKYVAEYNVSTSFNIPKLISTGFRITCYASLFVGVIMTIFSKKLAVYILYDVKYWMVFVVFGFTVIFYSINGLLLAVLNGLKKYKEFNILNITLNIVSLIVTLVLTYFFKIYGVLISVILNQSIVLIVTLLFLRKETWLKKENFSLKIDKKEMSLLFAFASMGILSSAITPITSILIRNNIIHNISLSDAGIYEFVQRISGAALIFFGATLSTYFLPRISEISNKKELLYEIKKISILSFPIIFVLLLIVYLLRDYIILLLGSKDFLQSEGLFIYALIGVFFKACTQIYGFVFVAKAKIKSVIIIEVLYNFFLVLLSIALIKTDYLKGALQAFMICNVIYFLGVCSLFYYNFVKEKEI